ncbi:hypothetical protein D3C78_1346550 [compost metagenome]
MSNASPDPAEILAARKTSGLSQTAAAELVHSKLRTWQQWEAGDRRMHPGLWELFQLKTATLTVTSIVERARDPAAPSA